jgi:hypothetical protein
MACRKCGGDNISAKGKCRDCAAAYMREWVSKNPDKKRASDKKYHEMHREQYLESHRRTHEKYKEDRNKKRKERYREDKEHHQAVVELNRQLRRAADPELFKSKNSAYMRRWRARPEWNLRCSMVVARRLQGIDDVRPDPNNQDIAQARCAYCNKWYNPTKRQVLNRLRVIDGTKTGESRLYCSNGCRESCPVFNTIKWPRGFRKATSREVDPDLRKMVFERDDWKCQICGAESPLHCHHIEGYTLNKIIANDVDNCLTLCKSHHKWVHSKEGCRYFELQCREPQALAN